MRSFFILLLFISILSCTEDCIEIEPVPLPEDPKQMLVGNWSGIDVTTFYVDSMISVTQVFVDTISFQIFSNNTGKGNYRGNQFDFEYMYEKRGEIQNLAFHELVEPMTPFRVYHRFYNLVEVTDTTQIWEYYLLFGEEGSYRTNVVKLKRDE